jgi:two-component system, chemotaxis family, chemotaxis protein CheY
MKTLIVEDDFTSRLLLQTLLSRYGECHLAANGIEAVEAVREAIAKRSRYDLICMDIMMPLMDGQEALRRVRDLEENAGFYTTAGARIIMTTAVTETADVFKSFQSLCDAYLFKPIDTNKLLGHLRAYHLIGDR